MKQKARAMFQRREAFFWDLWTVWREKGRSVASIHLPLYKWILLFWTNSCCAINSICIWVNNQCTFFFKSWLPVSEKWREKKLSYFSYCCSQIILVLVLQLICKTVFFSYLHYSLALLVADLALSERIIASGDGWQSGSKGPPHLLQGFLMLDTVKFQVDVATEPLVLTDVDILYCIELSCSWVVFPFECCLLIMHFKKKKSIPFTNHKF